MTKKPTHPPQQPQLTGPRVRAAARAAGMLSTSELKVFVLDALALREANENDVDFAERFDMMVRRWAVRG